MQTGPAAGAHCLSEGDSARGHGNDRDEIAFFFRRKIDLH